MSLNRAYQWCALSLAVLGVIAYATAAQQSATGAPGLLVWALPALCTGWYLSVARSFALPRAAVNALLTGALGYAALRTLSGIDVSTVAELVIFLLVIKVGDRRSPRDDGQIISLSIFLAIAAMLTGNSLLVGVLLLAFLPLLVGTVMLFQLQAGWLVAHHPAGALHDPAHPSGKEAGAHPRRWADVRAPGLARLIRRTVAGSSLGILAVALVVFVVLPRGVGENFLGPFGQVARMGTTTAFTDSVSLGDRGLISDNPEIAFTVEIRQEGGENLGNNDTVFYLRGAVLDRYQVDTHTWTPSNAGKQAPGRVQTGSSMAAISIGSASGPLVQQTVRVPHVPRNARVHLFGMWRPVTVEVSRNGWASVFAEDAVVESERGDGGPLTYTVRSVPIEFTGDEPEVRTPASYGSRPIRELAARILSGASIEPDPERRPVSDDARAARMIQDFLRTGYAYTLSESGIPSRADPIEHFLFESRAGHCEYFASAMVALCRSVGINARMVAGYVAAEFNEATGQYTVRQLNAHAWVEAEAGAGAWRRYDPTPATDLERLHKPAPGLLTRLRHILDAAEYAWNNSIVGFDEHAREKLLAPTARPGDALAARLEPFASRLRLGGSRLFLLALARGAIVFSLVALAGFALLFVHSRFRSTRSPRARRIEPRGLRFYAEFLGLLQRLGSPKPAWMPPLAHAGTLADVEAADAAGALAGLYYRARFGGAPLTAAQAAEARALLGRMRALRGRSAPRAQRPPVR
jgi:protein-glutamine gamma-glutamyltransferase